MLWFGFKTKTCWTIGLQQKKKMNGGSTINFVSLCKAKIVLNGIRGRSHPLQRLLQAIATSRTTTKYNNDKRSSRAYRMIAGFIMNSNSHDNCSIHHDVLLLYYHHHRTSMYLDLPLDWFTILKYMSYCFYQKEKD
jgi:hypothetical protein